MIGVSLERTYDIFEIVEDSPFWRGAVKGHDDAIEKAKEYARETRNEIRVIHILENAVVAVINQKRVQHRPQ